MKIACISDLHGQLPKILPCDLLLIAGDLCPHFARPGTLDDMLHQAHWLTHTFNPWLEFLPINRAVAIWGNHDFIGQKRPALVPPLMNCHLLNDSGCEFEGLKIWGTPWQPKFYDWAFNAPPGEEGEEFLDDKFSQIPKGTDILLCHGPAPGCGDVAPDGQHTGSQALLKHIKRVKPQLSVHGHIHCGYGQYDICGIKVINSALCDEDYKMIREPVYVEI